MKTGIDWRAMNDFANILRHGHHAVNKDQVWNIVQHDLPTLRAFVKQALLDREHD